MFKMRMAAVLVSCAGLLSAANAETLKISGLYPAARDGATQVESGMAMILALQLKKNCKR